MCSEAKSRPFSAIDRAFAHIPGGATHGFRIASEIARYRVPMTPRHGEFYRAIPSPASYAVVTGVVIKQRRQDYSVEFSGLLPAEVYRVLSCAGPHSYGPRLRPAGSSPLRIGARLKPAVIRITISGGTIR